MNNIWDSIPSPESCAKNSSPIKLDQDLFLDKATKRVGELTHTYNFSFRDVVHAYFTKFNHVSLQSVNTSLAKIETVAHETSKDRKLVYRKRHIYIKTPAIIQYVYWNPHLIFEEESWCDFNQQILQFKTINITAQDIALVTEHSKLYVDSQDNSRTHFLELAGIHVKMEFLYYPLIFFLDQQGRESAKQSIALTEKALLFK
jgi:PRELI-like family